jgi:hypothetical protein
MALFPKPERTLTPLSTALGAGQHRAAGADVTWTKRQPRKRADCDECVALQHETGGLYWPRRMVRHRRKVNGTTLDLCNGHALEWRARDEQDT